MVWTEEVRSLPMVRGTFTSSGTAEHPRARKARLDALFSWLGQRMRERRSVEKAPPWPKALARVLVAECEHSRTAPARPTSFSELPRKTPNAGRRCSSHQGQQRISRWHLAIRGKRMSVP